MLEEQKVVTTIHLSWERVLEQFESLIKFAARQQVQTHATDNMMSAEDLYQDGMIKLYDCWKIWCVGKNKDMNEFSPIFKKSLFREMAQRGNIAPSKPKCVNIEENMLENMLSISDDTVENIYLITNISRLQNSLSGDISKSLVEELYRPSTRTLFEVWADTQRKLMLKSQGKRVNIPKDATIRMKHIIRSLGITLKQYDTAMEEIKEKAKLMANMWEV